MTKVFKKIAIELKNKVQNTQIKEFPCHLKEYAIFTAKIGAKIILN